MIDIETSFDKKAIKEFLWLKIKIILIFSSFGVLFGIYLSYETILNFDDKKNKIYAFYMSLIIIYIFFMIIVMSYIGYRIWLKKNIVFKITDRFIIQESSKGVIKMPRNNIKKIVNNFLGLIIVGKEKIWISRYVENYNKILKELNK